MKSLLTVILLAFVISAITFVLFDLCCPSCYSMPEKIQEEKELFMYQLHWYNKADSTKAGKGLMSDDSTIIRAWILEENHKFPALHYYMKYIKSGNTLIPESHLDSLNTVKE